MIQHSLLDAEITQS